jgi:hypothetical protein
MSRQHTHEVYALWLVISFFFTLFLGLGLAAQHNDIGLTEVCGSYAKRCEQVLKALTTFQDELELVTIFAALTIIPQILAYFFSALSGAASAPYVHRVQQIAAWSIIKFVASLGGLSAGLIFVKVKGINFEFVGRSSLIASAFWLAAFYLYIEDAFSSLLKKSATNGSSSSFPIRALINFHKWGIRNVPEQPPRSVTRTALIAALESDLIYDYMLQDLQQAKTLCENSNPLPERRE